MCFMNVLCAYLTLHAFDHIFLHSPLFNSFVSRAMLRIEMSLLYTINNTNFALIQEASMRCNMNWGP